MDQFNITLRNLYRMLSVNDYPIFSNGVLTKKYRTGLTLMSFWRQVLVPQWQEGLYGREIWDKEKGRYASDFCNLKDTVPFYDEYREEILSTLTQGLLLEQIDRFSVFLSEHHYHEDVFCRKFEFLINASQENGLLTKQDCRFFLTCYSKEARKEMPPLFCDAWIITMMTVCAMCGTPAGAAQFVRQVEEKGFGLQALHRYESEREEEALPLRKGNSSVYGSAEDAALFFGRERELYDLTEAVNQKKKVFITGVGGIGKTELLRQLQGHLQKTRKFKTAVSAQYTGSLRESIALCFDSLQSQDLDQAFHEGLYLIGKTAPGSLILLIDNAEIAEEETACWQELAALKCPVVVTSRENAPDGFSEIRLEELHEHAALLLMRRHYKNALTEEEKDMLIRSIREYRFLQHPLTIRLIALNASRSDWKIEEIIRRAAKSSAEEETAKGYPQLKRIYRSLYREDKLSAEEKQLVSVLSVLPYRQYTQARLQAYSLPDVSAEAFTSLLDHLTRKGWIEHKAQCYSMHPLIAECLRDDGYPAEVFAGLFHCLNEQMAASGGANFLSLQGERDILDLCEDALCASRSIRDGLSSEDMELLLSAVLEGYSMMSMSAKDVSAVKKLLGDLQMQTAPVQLLWQMAAMLLREPFDSEQALSLLRTCSETGALTEKKLIDYGTQFLFNVPFAKLPREDAEKCIDWMETVAKEPFLQFKAAFYAVYYYMTDGLDVEHILSSYEKLEERYRTGHRKMDEKLSQSMMACAYIYRATVAVLLGDIPGAKQYAALSRKLPKADWGSNSLMEELALKTLLARTEGDLKTAIEKGEENVELTRKYFGEQNINFLIAKAELAIVLNQAGRTDEAIALYQDTIAQTKERFPGIDRLGLWLNNLSVAYLTAQQPEKAIEVLTESMEYPMIRDEVFRAEVSCNFSKAYRQLGDPDKEKDYLLQAEPAFSKVYGPQHPKTIYTLERLKELE